MRTILLSSCILFATASIAGGQDLQYRMSMEMTSPANPMFNNRPAMITTVSMRGGLMRTDMTMPGGMEGMSMIITGDSVFMLMHEEAQYTAMDLKQQRAAMQAIVPPDSSVQLPKLIKTGEIKEFEGYAAERAIWSMELTTGGPAMQAFGGDVGPLLIVGEAWLARDSALNAAFKEASAAMTSLASSSGSPLSAMQKATTEQFPFINTMVMLPKPEGSYDVEKILSDATISVLVRMYMTASKVSLAPLPDATFQVPGTFTKTTF